MLYRLTSPACYEYIALPFSARERKNVKQALAVFGLKPGEGRGPQFCSPHPLSWRHKNIVPPRKGVSADKVIIYTLYVSFQHLGLCPQIPHRVPRPHWGLPGSAPINSTGGTPLVLGAP